MTLEATGIAERFFGGLIATRSQIYSRLIKYDQAGVVCERDRLVKIQRFWQDNSLHTASLFKV
jgi:hypothetical protein